MLQREREGVIFRPQVAYGLRPRCETYGSLPFLSGRERVLMRLIPRAGGA